MQETLQDRVSALELQMRTLTEIVKGKKAAKGWRSAIGWARDDKGFDEWSGWVKKRGGRIAKRPAPMLILDTDHLTELDRAGAY